MSNFPYEIPGFSYSRPAAADYSVKATSGQFRFHKINSAGNTLPCAALDRAIGVRQNNPKAGEATTLVHTGIVFVEAGEAIAIGDPITSGTAGVADVATGAQPVLGTAFSAAGAAGELICVLLSLVGTGTVSNVSVITVPFSFTGSTRDILTDWTPGFAGEIVSLAVQVTTATTDVDADATVNAEIGSTNVTGGVVTFTDTAGVAAATPAGKVIAGSAVTAGYTFSATDTISLELAVTNAFSDGAGQVLLAIRS